MWTLEARKKASLKKIGSKNHQWIENNPSYGSVHIWLDRNFKKLKCEQCNSSRFVEWALKKKCQHTHKRENYLCLCSSCHKKYDYTDERKKKLSASLKKVPRTKIWLERMSMAAKGHLVSEEQRKKISEYQKLNPRSRNEKGQLI
jgi:hypothetical protein